MGSAASTGYKALDAAKDNPCYLLIIPVQAATVIAIVIDLPSFLRQKFRQENPANRNRIQL